MAVEIEGKFRVEALEPIASRLRECGAGYEGTAQERNWVLDRPDGSLFRSGRLLRVRSTDGVSCIMTVKEKRGGGVFKTREEVETVVDSGEDLLRQMAMLGFVVSWIYEKRRATWVWLDCVLALDECPEIGCFVEIEGTPENIRRAAEELGLDAGKHIPEGYLDLWRDYLQRRGEADRHMVFA